MGTPRSVGTGMARGQLLEDYTPSVLDPVIFPWYRQAAKLLRTDQE
ncbi:MAG: hypothetical protein IGS38_15535 [Synechococcales cyanobacterium M58_A2018_015]|nr:hypothetical protein [Synechococcales cyanobacterium M58_A2018_015]